MEIKTTPGWAGDNNLPNFFTYSNPYSGMITPRWRYQGQTYIFSYKYIMSVVS
jgi:Tol biopolymer transport system component